MAPPLAEKYRIAERLAQARRNLQPALSQSALAEKSRAAGLKECSGSRISRLEAGYADAEWPEVETLAAVLNVTGQWLAGLSDTLVAVPPPVVSAPETAVPAIEPAPVPLNGEHPDHLALSRSAHRSDHEHRQYLTAALTRARTKIHEAGLPPADWRHWRLVERRALEELRRSP